MGIDVDGQRRAARAGGPFVAGGGRLERVYGRSSHDGTGGSEGDLSGFLPERRAGGQLSSSIRRFGGNEQKLRLTGGYVGYACDGRHVARGRTATGGQRRRLR